MKYRILGVILSGLFIVIAPMAALASPTVNEDFDTEDPNPIVLESIDGTEQVYRLNTTFEAVNEQDDNLICHNNKFFIKLEGDLYTEAQKVVFTKDDLNTKRMSSLKPETMQVVKEIFKMAADNEDFELENNSVEVYVPQIDFTKSPTNTKAAAYTVVNEQVRYKGVTNEKVIASGAGKFEASGQQLLNNIAKLITSKLTAYIDPYAGNILTISRLFPSKYNQVYSYTNWTLGVKLHEEKVVQLSWVYVGNTPYLGAQTQFSTIKYTSILSRALGSTTTEDSSFMYYRTTNYQNPANIARNNYNNTWVERISSYQIKGTTFNTLAY